MVPETERTPATEDPVAAYWFRQFTILRDAILHIPPDFWEEKQTLTEELLQKLNDVSYLTAFLENERQQDIANAKFMIQALKTQQQQFTRILNAHSIGYARVLARKSLEYYQDLLRRHLNQKGTE